MKHGLNVSNSGDHEPIYGLGTAGLHSRTAEMPPMNQHRLAGFRTPSASCISAVGAMALTVIAVASGSGGGISATASDGNLGSPSAPERTTATDSSHNETIVPASEEIRAARNLSRAFRQVARQLAPSVVSVNTVDKPPYDGQPAMPIGFGGRTPDRYGKGSGVILSADGFVVTNFHVVRGADEIMIRLMDQRELIATIIGVDPDTDLAILKVEAIDLVPVRFGDSEAIEPGEWVIALGNPFGLEQTVTSGIISAKGRSGMGLATYENFLQTDAAINPGNSGGALVDLDGRLIGINTAISSADGGNHGVGFAIPSTMVERIANELIERGHVLRGWLGVGVAPAMRGDRMLPGALLSHVAPNTPAWRAGLRVGDMVVKLDDHEVATPSDFIRFIGDRQPSSEVLVTAVRQGRPLQAKAVLGERPTPMTRRVVRSGAPGVTPPADEPTASSGSPPAERQPTPSTGKSGGGGSVRERELARPVE